MNALARETSPYLRQHATNPVDWKPWGNEAWQLAREENKPIFLSIGYSTCHWCHVMAHESFENPVLAELLNREFVPVKVDREERPDLDHLYMLFVQATTGQGGWPMSVWLTPDLKPFYGGTYFPPEDRWGRPGFGTVLERISELWHAEQSSIVQQSDQILLNLAQSTAGSSETALPDARSLEMGFQQSASQYDPAEGGFSRAPKFPRPSMFNFLLRYADRRETDPLQRKQAREMVLHTLDKMAAGGMYDQLGGGFHRYSVDAEWHVPHFEKMLYDQAQLVVAYLEAYQLTGRLRYAMVIRETLDYVRRQLTSELGGFYAAEDADSLKEAGRADHAEGAFYVWAAEEIDGILGPEESARFKNEYGVKPSGNAPAGSDPHEEFVGLNILKLQSQGSILDPGMEKARKKLWAVRELRPRPHRDEKIITAWNGLMISAFARAGAALHRVDDLGVAEKAADFVLTRLTDGDGLLLRTYCEGPGSVKGFASDYACFIQGLLDLFESTGTLRWLRAAWQLQQQMDRLFWDARQGGYFEASDEDPSLLLRLKETYDGAEPAANSIAASNLLRLGDLLGQAKLHEGATRIFQSAASVLTQSPTAVPQLQAALTRFLAPPVHLVITGDPADPRTEPLWRVAQEVFLPQKSLLLLPPEGSLSFLGHQADFFDGLRAAATQPSAFLCEELRCHRPVTEPGQLRELISGVGTKGERPEARG